MQPKIIKNPMMKDIVCPYCKGTLSVSVNCLSIPCQHCNRNINVKALIDPDLPVQQKKIIAIEQRKLFCYKCKKEISVDKGAQAVMCKYCYHRNDLSDHKLKTIIGTVFQTHGRLYLVRNGVIETSTIEVGNAIIKGKVIGDITALGTVEILKKGTIKGKITCRKLIVKKGGSFEGHVQMLNPDGSPITIKPPK